MRYLRKDYKWNVGGERVQHGRELPLPSVSQAKIDMTRCAIRKREIFILLYVKCQSSSSGIY